MLTNLFGTDYAGRSALNSAISKISACATWWTGAVPKTLGGLERRVP